MGDLATYEREFRRAGLPTFVARRTARRDIWTRAVPLLTVVALGQVVGAVDLGRSAAANTALLLGGVALLLGGFVVVNLVRGRSPLARLDDVGSVELAAFVLVPAVLPLALNGQLVSALVTAAANAALLAVLYAVIGYGVLSIVVWSGRRLLDQLVAALSLVARAIPLLLLFSVVLFINTEMWQTFALLSVGRLAGVVGLLLAVSTLFLAVRLPREVGRLEAGVLGGEVAPPLDRTQRVNVGLVLFVAQGLQVLVVALATGGFFVVLGLLAIPPSLVETWTGLAPEPVGGTAVTRELLQVAVAIAAVSGFYYSVAVLTDATYREEFAEELTEEMRASFRTRALYLAALPR